MSRVKNEIIDHNPEPILNFNSTIKVKHYFNCQQCEFQCSNKTSLRDHVKSYHVVGGILSCNQCKYKTPRERDLIRHIKSIHQGIKYPCQQCTYKATQQGDLKRHVRTVHDGVKYPCEVCDYHAPLKNVLNTHMKTKHFLLSRSSDSNEQC